MYLGAERTIWCVPTFFAISYLEKCRHTTVESTQWVSSYTASTSIRLAGPVPQTASLNGGMVCLLASIFVSPATPLLAGEPALTTVLWLIVV